MDAQKRQGGAYRMKHIRKPVGCRCSTVLTAIAGCIAIHASILPCWGQCQEADHAIREIGAYLEQATERWPDSARQQYIDLVRRILSAHRGAPAFLERAQIARRGLTALASSSCEKAPALDDLAFKTQWFLEDLMLRPLLSGTDRDRLYEQYTRIFHHVRKSLREEFTFLPEEVLDKEFHKWLEKCQVAIKEGFLPIFGRLLCEQEIGNICDAWDRAFAHRSTMWSHMRASLEEAVPGKDEQEAKACVIVAFVARGYDSLIHQVWAVAGHAPVPRDPSGADQRPSENSGSQPDRIRPSVGRTLDLRFRSAKDIEDWGFILGVLLSASGPAEAGYFSEKDIPPGSWTPQETAEH